MKRAHEAHPLHWVGLLLLLCTTAVGQDDHISAGAAPDRPRITLSEAVRITVTIEGPAPLRVEVPEKVLAPESSLTWEIHPDGPAKVEPIEKGRERWTQTFRLKPWLPGEKVAIAFAAFKVTAGNALNPQSLTLPATAIAVITGVAEPKPENARPVTGIEELPPLIVEPPDRVGWLIVGGVTTVFALAVLAALRRKRRTKPLAPHEWAAAEFDRLERAGAAGRELADRLAGVLREFVERRFGLPAPRLTTSELLIECERAGWSVEAATSLREVLDRCDRAKFAGDAPDAAEGAELRARARLLASGVA